MVIVDSISYLVGAKSKYDIFGVSFENSDFEGVYSYLR
jgi:hypothetical protein